MTVQYFAGDRYSGNMVRQKRIVRDLKPATVHLARGREVPVAMMAVAPSDQLSYGQTL